MLQRTHVSIYEYHELQRLNESKGVVRTQKLEKRTALLFQVSVGSIESLRTNELTN